MVEKHEKNISTYPPRDPQLWLEVRVIDRSNKNQVYGMLMASTKKMRYDHTASNIGTYQSDPSQSVLEFKVRIL